MQNIAQYLAMDISIFVVLKRIFPIFSFISPFMKIKSFCTEFNIMTEVLVKYSSKNDLDIAASLLCCNWRPVFTLLGT